MEPGKPRQFDPAALHAAAASQRQSLQSGPVKPATGGSSLSQYREMTQTSSVVGGTSLTPLSPGGILPGSMRIPRPVSIAGHQSAQSTLPSTPTLGTTSLIDMYEQPQVLQSTRTSQPPPQFPTTMMLRNIPTDTPLSVLVGWLEEGGFGGLFDYAHLPSAEEGDDSTRTRGYAFINFAHPAIAATFAQTFEGRPLQGPTMLRVGHVLTAKSHGFRQNVQHRVNLAGTGVFLLGSGTAVGVPRGPEAIRGVETLNRAQLDRMRGLLESIGSSEVLSVSELRNKLGMSLNFQRTEVESAPGATVSAKQQVSVSTSGSHHLLVLPRGMSGLGVDGGSILEKLAERMHFIVEVVENCSALCERAEELVGPRDLGTEAEGVVVVIAGMGELEEGSAGSAVLREFLLEGLQKVDGIYLTGDGESVSSLPLNTKKVINVFDLGVELRKIVKNATNVTNQSANQPTPQVSTSLGICIVKKKVFDATARNLKQGGFGTVLQPEMGTQLSVLRLDRKAAVLLCRDKNGEVGFIPVEFTDWSDRAV